LGHPSENFSFPPLFEKPQPLKLGFSPLRQPTVANRPIWNKRKCKARQNRDNGVLLLRCICSPSCPYDVACSQVSKHIKRRDCNQQTSRMVDIIFLLSESQSIRHSVSSPGTLVRRPPMDTIDSCSNNTFNKYHHCWENQEVDYPLESFGDQLPVLLQKRGCGSLRSGLMERSRRHNTLGPNANGWEALIGSSAWR
jgi:hypothetical protein